MRPHTPIQPTSVHGLPTSSKSIARDSRLSALWLATGLVLSTATQLRSASLPVGPGELMLAAWLLGNAFFPSRPNRTPQQERLLSRTLLFWFASLALNVIGAGVADFLQVADHSYFGRELTAILLAGLVTIAWLRSASEASPDDLAKYIVNVGGCFIVGLFLIASFVTTSVGKVEFWYSVRFRGMSHNPNQLALLLTALPFLAAHLGRTAGTRLTRAWYATLVAGSIAVGLATQSDALLVAWVSGAGCLTLTTWWRLTRSPNAGHATRMVLAIIAPLVLISAGLAYGPRLLSTAEVAFETMYDYGGQGAGRITLWDHGLEAIEVSPVFGLGPGPKSGFTGPLQGAEAHNTFVDWGASTGLVGLAVLLAYLTWLAVQGWKRGSTLMFSLEISLIVFAVFHYVVRHPMYWCYSLIAVSVRPISAASRSVPQPALAMPEIRRAAK